ncbi:MAG: tetratricopeptide repeat protein [Deltaproteobacteria bacterium]|jgi:tetratricopeptide (TPR) repeat protein|nr:tetratricopeptide repeat protein [Deltaproteobacteria bacterium]
MKLKKTALLIFLVLGLTWPETLPAQTASSPSLVETVEKGYLAYRRADYDEAIEIFTSIIRRRGLSIKERAVSYLLRGEAKREKGELEEAVFDFTRAINQWPNYPQAIFFRGQALIRLNRFSEALADLSRAAELDPNRQAYQTTLELLKIQMEKAGIRNDLADSPGINAPFED